MGLKRDVTDFKKGVVIGGSCMCLIITSGPEHKIPYQTFAMWEATFGGHGSLKVACVIKSNCLFTLKKGLYHDTGVGLNFGCLNLLVIPDHCVLN